MRPPPLPLSRTTLGLLPQRGKLGLRLFGRRNYLAPVLPYRRGQSQVGLLRHGRVISHQPRVSGISAFPPGFLPKDAARSSGTRPVRSARKRNCVCRPGLIQKIVSGQCVGVSRNDPWRPGGQRPPPPKTTVPPGGGVRPIPNHFEPKFAIIDSVPDGFPPFPLAAPRFHL